ncbi:hypothetical protein IVB12_15525 [Bradyrhizobium sp. 179]|uniref:hypothetical protein n=1 Tax=Bradyrhizobium sp. 179 TaxID=2782648 RepID=UPI001FFA7038|nr:hypothetical protein [Bradyrhizobium sp. 179]MCK1543325.1 hypothetical protein [Bradyrhizobium sp. 179]
MSNVIAFKPRQRMEYETAAFIQKLRPVSCDGLLTQKQVIDAFFADIIAEGYRFVPGQIEQAREYFRTELLPGVARTLEESGLFVEDLTT